MDQAFNSFFQLDEDAKVGDIGDWTFNNRTAGIIIESSHPWVWLELFNAKGESFIFPVNL